MAPEAVKHPIREHERFFDEIKESQKDHEKRIKALEEMSVRQDEKVKQIFIAIGEIKQLLSSAMDEMKKDNEKTVADMKEIIVPLSGDVEVLKGKPGKTWEKIKYVVLSAVISGIVGILLGLLFGGGKPGG